MADFAVKILFALLYGFAIWIFFASEKSFKFLEKKNDPTGWKRLAFWTVVFGILSVGLLSAFRESLRLYRYTNWQPLTEVYLIVSGYLSIVLFIAYVVYAMQSGLLWKRGFFKKHMLFWFIEAILIFSAFIYWFWW